MRTFANRRANDVAIPGNTRASDDAHAAACSMNINKSIATRVVDGARRIAGERADAQKGAERREK